MGSYRNKILWYLLIGYILLAGMWWSYLLYVKNGDAFKAKTELLIYEMRDRGLTGDHHLKQSLDFKDLQKKYDRQKWMILAEGSVLMITLMLGVFLMNRGFSREVKVARQQRNFLLSITHELKSPLASIQLVLETFLKRNLNPDQAKQFASNAYDDTQRLKELVENLLLAARLEDRYEIAEEVVPLSELLEDLLVELSRNHQNAVISWDIDRDLHKKADKATVSAVVRNLVENGIKYSPKDRQFIHVKLFSKGRHLILEVADKGFGIPDEEKEQIFSKFYRVGNEDTRKAKGTGLGLYIVKEFVKAHKGRVKVRNHQPVGTIFSIWLPKE